MRTVLNDNLRNGISRILVRSRKKTVRFLLCPPLTAYILAPFSKTSPYHRIIVPKFAPNLNIQNLNIFKIGTEQHLAECNEETLRYMEERRDRNTVHVHACAYTYVCIERSRPRIAVKQCVCNDGRGLNNSVTRTYAGMSDT